MDEDVKKGLKRMMLETEAKVTESFLKWVYKKEGKAVPDDLDLKERSRIIVDQTNKTLSKSGKNIWNEFKSACQEKSPEEEED
ncbi:MAG: hypothetical protein JRJ85_06895 [Deltaproteobacteria bacterium]|nr:hypothetical protein [Deltaproteobacteria bacterium]